MDDPVNTYINALTFIRASIDKLKFIIDVSVICIALAHIFSTHL